MHDSFMKFVKKAMPNWKAGNGKDEPETIEINYYPDDNNPRMIKRRTMSNASLNMQNDFKEEMSAFFTHTSFTALSQIYKANSVWKRLLWTILLISMFVWMFIQCYWLLDRYYKYPMEVKMDFKAAPMLEFPSVTICNLNPIKEDKTNHESYEPLRKFINPNVHDFLFHEIMHNWLQDANDTRDFSDARQLSTDNYSNIPEAAKVKPTTASSPLLNSNYSNKTTQESARSNNKTQNNRISDNNEIQSKNTYYQYNGTDHNHHNQASSEEEETNYLKEYLISLWYRMENNMTKEQFIDALHDSYLAYQKSLVLTGKVAGDAGNISNDDNSKEQESHKRDNWSSQIHATSNTTLNIKWERLFENSTFNKWNMLSSSMSRRFYEQRDDEYEAAMMYAYITSKLNLSLVEKSGHQKEDFIAACDFNGYQCSPENFTYFHNPKFGNCYIFNSYDSNMSLETRFAGPDRGLRLELFLEQDNYVANLATEAGARILVHKKGSVPFPEDEGISVLPGRSTSIGLRQVSYTRLPPPHGECDNKGETTDYYQIHYGTDYSKLSCIKSCYQDLIVKSCNCSLPFYFVLDVNRVCDMTNNEIEKCVNKLQNSRKRSFAMCDNKCPLPCKDIKYALFVSSAKWPSEKYQPFLNLQLHQTNWMYRNIQESDKQFTKLQIYFRDLIYQHMEQQKSYESMNLISDLGGQLGLWLGLSAITIGELCSCLFGVGRLLPLKCWGNKPTQSHVKITPLRSIEPATLQEMCEDMCPAPAKYIPPYYVSSNSVPACTNV